MVRLFISINVPIEIKEKLKLFQNKLKDLMEGTLTPIDNLHITIKYLGEVKDVEQIKSICIEAIPLPKFTAEIKGISVFPSTDRIRIIWAGIGAGTEALASIRKGLDERLDKLGFGDDKDFRAHITLARVKKVLHKGALKSLIKNNHDNLFGKFRVERVSLMESLLGKTGAAHSEIASFTLS